MLQSARQGRGSPPTRPRPGPVGGRICAGGLCPHRNLCPGASRGGPRDTRAQVSRQPGAQRGAVHGDKRPHHLARPESLPEAVAPKAAAVPLNETIGFATEYKQKRYLLEDPQGDVSLIVFTRHIPKVLLKVQLGLESMPLRSSPPGEFGLNPIVQEEKPPELTEKEIEDLDLPEEVKETLRVEIKNRGLTLDGRKNPIRVREMAAMFTRILAEEMVGGIMPQYGTPHTWSRLFVEQYKSRFENRPYTWFSKHLLALSSGVTSRLMVTDKELDLLKYILSRPDNSITIHELFRESYRLNNGDVYLTLLTMENILSEYWRSPQRENRAVTRKLSAITNHYNGKDKFGTWYHLVGTMLYGYVSGGFSAGLVGWIENLGSRTLSGADGKTQKGYVNVKGAAVGAMLKDIVEQRKYLEFNPDGRDSLNPATYLDLTEDFRDRLHVAFSKEIQATLSQGLLYLKSTERDYLGCSLDVIPDFGEGLNSEYRETRTGFSLPRGKEVLTPVPLPRPTLQVRAFLTGCQVGGDIAVKAADPWARRNRESQGP